MRHNTHETVQCGTLDKHDPIIHTFILGCIWEINMIARYIHEQY